MDIISLEMAEPHHKTQVTTKATSIDLGYTPGIRLLTINLNSYSDERRVEVTVRREEIKTIIHVEPKYDLIFAQEIPAPKSEAKKLDMATKVYGYLNSNKEAGLFWVKERLHLIETVSKRFGTNSFTSVWEIDRK